VKTVNLDQCRPIDAKFDRAVEFVKNYKEMTGNGMSNMYVIQTVDMDGNVTGEYYGKNLMTDYGMTQFFINNSEFPQKIYIGSGKLGFTNSSSQLEIPITTTGSTSTNTTIDYEYPMYYDNISGIITVVAKYLDCYFDYNIDGIGDEIVIGEYGIGTSTTALWTHSHIFDITGEQTEVRKKVNERLTFTVYLCYSYYESLIIDNWDAGKHILITSMKMFFDHMKSSGLCTYKRNNVVQSRSKTETTSAFVNNLITKATNMTAFNITNSNTASEGYVDGFGFVNSGFLILEPQQLAVPEAFEEIVTATNADTTDECISNLFGTIEELPFTIVTVSQCNMFNYFTGEWDNPSTFQNDNGRWYDETSLTNFGKPLWYTNNQTIVRMNVYVNPRSDDAITSFHDSAITTLYAADKYWDKTTWVWISDPSNVPQAARNAKYWLTPETNASLRPNRESGFFKIISQDGAFIQHLWTGATGACAQTCCNTSAGWFIRGTDLYDLNNGIKRSFTPSYSVNRYIAYGSNVFFYAGTDSRIYTASIPTSATTPQFSEMLIPFTTSTPMGNTFVTETGTGFACIHSATSNEFVIVDMRNSLSISAVQASKMSCAICNTTRIAYIDRDDTTKVKIIDISSGISLLKTITIPNGLTPAWIYGYRDMVYISDNTSFTYVINTTTETVTVCDTVVDIRGSSASITNYRCSACDDILVVYNIQNNDYTLATTAHWFLEYTNPTTPKRLTKLPVPNNDLVTTTYDCKLVKLKTNTIGMVWIRSYRNTNQYQGGVNVILDVGLFLKTGELKYFYHFSSNNEVGFVPYGNRIFRYANQSIPIEYLMPHKLIGTTRTITAKNHIKNISGKSWRITFSNICPFYEVPPGQKQ
jgi:hypothetical protein